MRLRQKKIVEAPKDGDQDSNDIDYMDEFPEKRDKTKTRSGRDIKYKPTDQGEQDQMDIEEFGYNDDFEEGGENELDNEQDEITEEESGVFNPAIDQILWRREVIKKDEGAPETKNKEGIFFEISKSDLNQQRPEFFNSKINGSDQKKVYEFYVKFNDFSYLHCEWITEEDILSMGKTGKNKLNRFNRSFEKKMLEGDVNNIYDDDVQLFDPSYLEVDKILYCTEIFSVIHPKKANDIKGKWSEHLVAVVSKLLNFSRDDVHYGVYFMEPVDTDRYDCNNYRKVITYQMD